MYFEMPLPDNFQTILENGKTIQKDLSYDNLCSILIIKNPVTKSYSLATIQCVYLYILWH